MNLRRVIAMKRFVVLITISGIILLASRHIECKRTLDEVLRDDEITPEMYFQELESDDAQKYGTRKLPPSKPYCNTDCNARKKEKSIENETTSSTTKYDSTSNEEEEEAVVSSKNKTSPKKKEKIKFSRQYNPSANSDDSGFVPIPSPFSKARKSKLSHRRAKLRSVDELTVKESRQNPDILGNGHFEILSGGMFADHETNEISNGGRRVGRMGRTFDTFALPPFQHAPFEPIQFSPFFQAPQLPTHPMFFPRAAYSQNSEIKLSNHH